MLVALDVVEAVVLRVKVAKHPVLLNVMEAVLVDVVADVRVVHHVVDVEAVLVVDLAVKHVVEAVPLPAILAVLTPVLPVVLLLAIPLVKDKHLVLS